MKNLFRNFSCIVFSVFAAYLLSVNVGALYCGVSGQCSANFPSIGFTPYVGFVLSYLFLVPFLLFSLGGTGKYWWLAIFVLPIFIWPLYLGMTITSLTGLILVPIGGLLVGLIARKAFNKFSPSFMSKIS